MTFDPGVVAYGYSDGYWTTKREWRTWEKPEYVEVYRKAPGARYTSIAMTAIPTRAGAARS